ncbi:helix-turn-helix transcriptional regulator [Peristeroidobacter soli]|uniref:helix-turn-helix transcriptional regulator n=1 Tax=Peristeroidobacter soli TaxID=2497877 RepID=UPI00101D35A4
MSTIKAESRAYFRALGKHISQLRKEIGMTQAELARALNVSQQAVFAYECVFHAILNRVSTGW